ncbi:MAG: TaqI-like C-terminal specificity domain-containing protein, partial [Bacillota bacterium]
DLETYNFMESKKLKIFQTFKDYGIQFASGATGFQAKKLIDYITDYERAGSIPFIVSGTIDKYRINDKAVSYMKRKYEKAYIIKGTDIADSKWALWFNEKIIIAGMTKVIEAIYFKHPMALGVGVYAIYNYGGFEPRFLTGVLNSKYLSYYLNVMFKEKHLAGGYLAINKSTLEELPLVDAELKIQNRVADLVDNISGSNSKDSILHYAGKIDEIIYDMYNLSDKEIREVEDFFNQHNLNQTGY